VLDTRWRKASLLSLMLKLDDLEKNATESFALLVENYSKSPNVLRAYGDFLKSVHNDLLSADKLYEEASDLEDKASGDSKSMLHEVFESLPASYALHSQTVALSSFSQVNESIDPFFILSGDGCFDFVNEKFCEIFGYKRVELVGRSITFLLPSVSGSKEHDRFVSGIVRNVKLGQKVLSGNIREVFALNKSGFVIPVCIAMNSFDTGGTTRVYGVAGQRHVPKRSVGFLLASMEGAIKDLDEGLCNFLGFETSHLRDVHVSAVLDSVTGKVVDEIFHSLKVREVGRKGETELGTKRCHVIITKCEGTQELLQAVFVTRGIAFSRYVSVHFEKLEEGTFVVQGNESGQLVSKNMGMLSSDIKYDVRDIFPLPFRFVVSSQLRRVRHGLLRRKLDQGPIVMKSFRRLMVNEDHNMKKLLFVEHTVAADQVMGVQHTIIGKTIENEADTGLLTLTVEFDEYLCIKKSIVESQELKNLLEWDSDAAVGCTILEEFGPFFTHCFLKKLRLDRGKLL